MKFAAVGSNCIDFYENLDGGTPFPGGGPVNMAVYAAEMGAQSAYVGPVGQDAFGQLLRRAVAEKGVDVRGEFPVYEMFPYKVRLDAENQDIYLDRKKVQCMRPKSFVEQVKAGQDKLNRANFNAQTFVNELSDAYDTAILKLKKQPGADIYLNSLYKLLAPMSRFRKDYDQQSFAFDLARLYAEGAVETKNGRKFQFGPSRNNGKAIRILDQEGKEQFLATIRFYE